LVASLSDTELPEFDDYFPAMHPFYDAQTV
jgi:hypothetical protein